MSLVAEVLAVNGMSHKFVFHAVHMQHLSK